MSKVGVITNCQYCITEKRTGEICPVHMQAEVREVGRTVNALALLRHELKESLRNRYDKVSIKINANLYIYLQQESARYSIYFNGYKPSTLVGFPVGVHTYDDYRIIAEIEL